MRNDLLRTLFLILLGALVWQVVRFYLLPKSFFPSTVEIAIALADSFTRGALLHHIVASLQRVVVGFIVATIFGISLGVVAGTIDAVGKIMRPFIEVMRPVPPIAWIPIAILLFGLGNISAYFIVFLGAFFPIFTNTYFGAVSMPVIYKNIAGSFEIRSLNYLWRIVFFYALPCIFTGLKIGIGMAWMSVIAAELVGAQTGLGYFIQINRLLLRIDNIIVGMVMIGVVGSILTFFMDQLGKTVMHWRKQYDIAD